MNNSIRLSINMSKLILVFPVIIVSIGIYLSIYPHYVINFVNDCLYYKPTTYKSERLFTPDDLLQYNGVHKPELYLALLGNVFNVTKGRKHYGSGETYNIFVGRDASRSFVTGKFDIGDISDDVTGLTKQELLSLNNWLLFYKRDYSKVGKVIGRYYNEEGKPTQYCREIKKLIKIAQNEKENEEMDKIKFPPCNVEWTAEHGSRVWCTRRSGGIERKWVGVPRKLYEPGSQSYRCACVNEENLNVGNIKQYEGCSPTFDSCYVKS